MIRNIVKDPFFLSQKSVEATKDDIQIAHDLLDTLKANREICVGLAANMIGYKKRIIAVTISIMDTVMINPVIKKRKNLYVTQEGCLSLDGIRETSRYEIIEVEYFDINFKKINRTFKDFSAQIIQHEIDHCNGILI